MSAKLPIEILIIVFELLASSSLNHAYTLALVASWTRSIAEKHLYSTLCGTTWEHDSAIRRLMWGDNDACRRQAKYVRSLWLGPADVYATDIPHLLQSFPNLRNLACDRLRVNSDTTNEEEMEAHSPKMLRQKASRMIQGGPFHLTLKSPMISESDPFILNLITHLRVMANGWQQLDLRHTFRHDLACFDSLTHLAVTMHHATVRSLPAIQKRFSLEMLVVEGDDRYGGLFSPLVTWVKDVRLQDNHIYLVPRREDRCASQWAEDAHGGSSIWERARAFTEQIDREGWTLEGQRQSRAGNERGILTGNEPVGYTASMFRHSVIGIWAKKMISFRK
ncbi:hypothetical protein PUNSTDRAFT_131767 [Punctularia strigosozonata HHB-11173 SS5]|uniref:uncharacterized protein n=1 Tax=Punctularia strigosozonata (strain HHB-11173) TaxID=741275 RepID=UPI0004417C03|nr:uncharacterized protein PUNSTDRAFT_131767 [Punctularia strigosozonata HHB-11173 SS5]EIN11608.1 hypothetical protein PUNSTDRAFT_131767 [Punctularia strigosozonata HHB-11173 SS5]